MVERARDDLGVERGGERRPPVGRGIRLPNVPDRYRYSIGELSEQTGVSARTIRYYVSQGLLAPAHGRGPTATYDLGHLLRLQMVQLLRDRHLPLQEIKEHLNRLSDEEIEAMLGIRTKPNEDRWRRIRLHDDLELHVRERAVADPAFDDAVEVIVGLAQPVIDKLDGGR